MTHNQFPHAWLSRKSIDVAISALIQANAYREAMPQVVVCYARTQEQAGVMPGTHARKFIQNLAIANLSWGAPHRKTATDGVVTIDPGDVPG